MMVMTAPDCAAITLLQREGTRSHRARARPRTPVRATLVCAGQRQGHDAGAAGGAQDAGAHYDTIVFDDGSMYTGTVRAGLPDGLGTCAWKDGNRYDGEWRQGLMHGFGTYIWTSGQRYDGEWKVRRRGSLGLGGRWVGRAGGRGAHLGRRGSATTASGRCGVAVLWGWVGGGWVVRGAEVRTWGVEAVVRCGVKDAAHGLLGMGGRWGWRVDPATQVRVCGRGGAQVRTGTPRWWCGVGGAACGQRGRA